MQTASPTTYCEGRRQHPAGVKKPLLVEGGTLHGRPQGFDNTSLPGDTSTKKNTYSMMIEFIERSLTKIDHLHSLFNKDTTTNDDDSGDIPTMASIAAKVTREDGT